MMIGFHERVQESYGFDDKRTEKLSIIYKGRNLYYISACNEFFCVSFQVEYIAYSVFNEQIIRIASSSSFERLEHHLREYINERDGAF